MVVFCLFGFVDVGRHVELGKNVENKLFQERKKKYVNRIMIEY